MAQLSQVYIGNREIIKIIKIYKTYKIIVTLCVNKLPVIVAPIYSRAFCKLQCDLIDKFPEHVDNAVFDYEEPNKSWWLCWILQQLRASL